MTFKILTDDTSKIIYRSNVRPANMSMEYNLRLDPLCGEPCKIVKSKLDHTTQTQMKIVGKESNVKENNNPVQNEDKPTAMAIINPSDLVGRSFLLDTNENGEKFRAKIVQAILTHGRNLESTPERMQYRCTINNDAYEEIMSYNEILHHLVKGISAH